MELLCLVKLFGELSNGLTLILMAIAISVFYLYYTATFDYFKKKGIPYMKPVLLFGNFGSRILASRSAYEYQMHFYNYFKGERFGGMFEGRQPVLYIFDPDLIKAILISDFDHFTDRNFLNSEEPRYINRLLVNLKGSEWKGVRSTMTPVFSSHRLKSLLPLLQLCSKQMVEYFKQYDNKDAEMKQATGHYTLETIGACAFGIKFNALNDENCHFFKLAEKFDHLSILKRLYMLLIYLFYSCAIRLRDFFNRESTDELVRMIQAAKEERRLSESKKSDILQILVDVARKENFQNGKSLVDNPIDDDTIDAQCLLFLIAGYETSSTLLSFAIHKMATRPDLQDRLREHINTVGDGEEINYESLAEMTYLDAFLSETLRMYPPVSGMDRVVTKPYRIPDTSITLKPGDVIAIPGYGIHMDGEHYPAPSEFRPERFMGDERKNRAAHLFLAFGAGPRHCIGQRFAMISAKVAVVQLLRNFKFSTCTKTENPIVLDKTSFLLRAKSGVWIRVQKIKD